MKKTMLQWTPVTLDEALEGKYTNLAKSIAEFLNGDAPAVRVEWRGRYVTAASMAGAIKRAAKRSRNGGLLTVRIRGDYVYLIKTILL